MAGLFWREVQPAGEKTLRKLEYRALGLFKYRLLPSVWPGLGTLHAGLSLHARLVLILAPGLRI